MSVEKTLQERGARYGDFSDHAELAQKLQDNMRNFKVEEPFPVVRTGICQYYQPWDRLSPDKKQALTVIADKIARILSGDPNYADNWHDIQGYAKLVEDRLPKMLKEHPHTDAGQTFQDMYDTARELWPGLEKPDSCNTCGGQ